PIIFGIAAQKLRQAGIAILAGQKVDVVLEVHGHEQFAAGAEDSSQFRDPRIRQVVDVREDGAGVDEAEVTVLKGEMRDRGRGDEVKRRAEKVLAPEKPAGIEGPTPKFARTREGPEPTASP